MLLFAPSQDRARNLGIEGVFVLTTLISAEVLLGTKTQHENGGTNQSLGKVRTERVKKVSRELIRRYPDKFTTDFESNKKVVMSLTTLSSIRLRNRIAGYISRLVAIEQKLKSGEEELEEIEETENAGLQEPEESVKAE